MSRLATKYIEDFEENMKNNNSYEHVVRMLLDERNETFDDVKKRSLFSAWRTVQWIAHTGDAYRYIFAERDAKKYYKADGSLDLIYLEDKYNIALGLTEGRNCLANTKKKLTKQWNIKKEIIELSNLFGENDNPIYNTKVYENLDGNLELVFEQKALSSFNLNSYFVSIGSDVLIMDENLWPQNELIINENKRVKAIVENELSKYKDGEKMTYLDYEKLFEYTIGKPRYIQYYMEKLDKKSLDIYKNKTWTFRLVLVFMYGGGSCGYTARDEGYVDMVIDYDNPLNLEEVRNV